MSAKMERFDEDARSVLLRAHEEVVQAKQSLIKPEHILLALVKDEGSAGKALAEQGADYEKLQGIVSDLANEMEISKSPDKEVDLSDEIKGLLQLTVDIVNQRKARSIGSGHLLLALLQQKDSRVSKIMTTFGFDRERLSKRTEELLASSQV